MDPVDPDELVIKSIDHVYYNEKDQFKLDYLTESFPSPVTTDYLIDYRERLEKQMLVVTRRVSDLILNNQPAYVEELQRITDLQSSLTQSIKVCTHGRECLDRIKSGFTKNGLMIVDNHRKRELLAQLLESLTSINSLKKTITQIRSIVGKDEDFPKAIELCLKSRGMLAELSYFDCVKELDSKLNDTLELIGEQVDIALSKICLSFNTNTYAKLQESYKLMGRFETAADQLLMHFCSAINYEAHYIVSSYLTQYTNTNKSGTEKPTSEHCEALVKKEFNELCSLLTKDNFLLCLLDICKIFWIIMLNYRCILNWHNIDLSLAKEDQSTMSNLLDQTSTNNVEEFNRTYIEQKLIGGLLRIWQDMKQKLRLLILNHDLSCYRFDDFIKILKVVERIISISYEFTCSDQLVSKDLQETINEQALNFFKVYHSNSIEELKMFLENELWEVLPVRSSFRLIQLKEFSFLRVQGSSKSYINSSKSYKQTSFDETSSTYFTMDLIELSSVEEQEIPETSISGDRRNKSYKLTNQTDQVNPFEDIFDSDINNSEDLFLSSGNSGHSSSDKVDYFNYDDADCGSDESDELFDELNRDFIDEDGDLPLSEDECHVQTSSSTKPSMFSSQSKVHDAVKSSPNKYPSTFSGPVLTNTSLNVLRLFGRYIQMMSVLEPISFDILLRLYNLLDHYTISVFEKFGSSDEKNISPRLKLIIQSIRESLTGSSSNSTTINQATHRRSPSYNHGIINLATLLNNDTTSEKNPKKSVAVESLIVLVNQLWHLQEYLESLIPPSKRPLLKEQFSQNNSLVSDFLKAKAELVTNDMSVSTSATANMGTGS